MVFCHGLFVLHILMFIGSGASSGSESDLTCLHGGLCIKQKQVSSKDTYIAIEALELLVACLQLRSSLLGEYHTVVKDRDR